MNQNNNKKSGMDLGNTQYFKVQPDQETGVKKILSVVYEALLEKGYDPVNQIVGYIMSGTTDSPFYSLLIRQQKRLCRRQSQHESSICVSNG